VTIHHAAYPPAIPAYNTFYNNLKRRGSMRATRTRFLIAAKMRCALPTENTTHPRACRVTPRAPRAGALARLWRNHNQEKREE